MTQILEHNATASLLGVAVGELVLRVRGTSRDGQVLRLKSPKCTIGAGSYCSLRLRAKGVRPLHCVVVRGAGSTIVRRWSADTRLNGREFTEATLLPGDLLGVGPIELEVIATSSTNVGRRDPVTNKAVADDAVPDELRDLLPASPFLNNPHLICPTDSSLAQEEQEREEDRHQWRRSLRTVAHGRVRRAIRRLREQSTEMEELENQWRQRVERLTDRRQSDQESWSQEREAWLTERELWDRQRAEWELQQESSSRAEVDAEEKTQQVRQRLSELEQELVAEKAQLETVRENLDDERSRLTGEAEELREHIESCQRNLVAERAELETLREELVSERNSLLEELTERKQESSGEEDAVAHLQAELERREEQLALRQTELESEIELFQAQRDKLAAEQDDLEALRAEFAEQELALQSLRDTRESESLQFAEQRAEFEAELARHAEQSEELARQRQEFTAEQTSLDAQRTEIRTQSEYLVEQRAELADRELQLGRQAGELTRRASELEKAELQVQESQNEMPTEVEPSSSGQDSPASTETVEAADPLDHDNPTAELPATSTTADELASGEAALPAEETPSDETIPDEAESDPESPSSEQECDEADGAAAEAAAEAEDDESIADYMQQLLARTRGVSQEYTVEYEMPLDEDLAMDDEVADSEGDSEELSSSWDAISTEETSPRSTTPDWELTMSPRRAAPEAGTDMEALRDLANQSAQTAIDTSLFNRWKSAAAGNACMSTICFVAGYMLIANASSEMSNAYLGGAAAFIGSIYWAVQCGLLMRHASWLHTGDRSGGYTTPLSDDPDAEDEIGVGTYDAYSAE